MEKDNILEKIAEDFIKAILPGLPESYNKKFVDTFGDPVPPEKLGVASCWVREALGQHIKETLPKKGE